MKKRARLSKEDIDVIKCSKLTGVVLADIMGCSVGTIDYHRNCGIWRKKIKSKKGSIPFGANLEPYREIAKRIVD